MADVTIRMAENARDFDIARDLCREWLDWHWKAFPEDGPRVGNVMAPDTFETVIQDLPQIHARPRGAILLAFLEEQPVGCVMYHAYDAHTAEIKRLFVSDAGRGYGIGQLMLERMFVEMSADGFQEVIFSSAKFLTHARRLYESVGFQAIDHPEDFPDHLRSFVYFMRRPLQQSA